MSASQSSLRFIDLFCGIGGFHYASMEASSSAGLSAQCLFASDIDPAARAAYSLNFGIEPSGDIREVPEEEVPDHDLLCGGFPCQAFSIIGSRRGFSDTRGTLFFEIARILSAKRPPLLLLENVKQLRSHDGGRTIGRVMGTLAELGYHAEYRVLNALDFGLPQKRERIFIAGFSCPLAAASFKWPSNGTVSTPLFALLESSPAPRYQASEHIRARRKAAVAGREDLLPLGIWHENKSKNVSVHPYSCALRAGASHSYLLVNGERRLTERELLRLQGFPDSHQSDGSYSVLRRQAGNSIPVPVAQAVLEAMLEASKAHGTRFGGPGQSSAGPRRPPAQ
jgi:DNA (cytosine-5)-methyltransferase 1